MDNLFKGGRLEMSGSPLPGPDAGWAWNDLLTNRILVVISIVLLLVCLLDLFRLFPALMYSFVRVRGTSDLEDSLGTARMRNRVAFASALPFCLLADRFALLRPDFWSVIPPLWSSLATVGLLAVFYLVRALCYGIFRPRRLASARLSTLFHAPYNYFILLTILMLAITVPLHAFHVQDAVIRIILRAEIVVFYFFAVLRSGQILAGQGLGFATILYLCGLEIIPAALLVAVVTFF